MGGEDEDKAESHGHAERHDDLEPIIDTNSIDLA